MDHSYRPPRQVSPPRRRSPGIAAFLSFLVPGLGQAWAGQARRGLLIALPLLVVIAIGILIAATSGLIGLASLALQPFALLVILALDLLFLAYRGWAIVDGARVARATQTGRSHVRASAGGGGGLVVAVLLVLVVASHGLVGYVSWNAYDLVTGVFGESADGRGPAWGDDVPATPTPPASPSATATTTPSASSHSSTSPSPEASASPSPSPSPDGSLPYWAEDGRLNILLLGGDAGPGRESIRTDTMILLTVDLATARAALAGIPRNLLKVPLPEPYASHFKGGVFPDLLNALWRYANDRPGEFPGNDQTRGFRAISAAVGNLTGVDIDGLAYVDLNGFVKVIDALGGLQIDVPYRIYDKRYPNEDGNGTRVLEIEAGLQRLDGSTALAFARSRHQDSDYGRMKRQQLVLLALRQQINPCTLLPRLPDMVAIAKESMYTNIPVDELPRLLALASQVDTSRIERIAFTPDLGYPETVTQASMGRMQRVIRDAFKGDPPPPEGGPDISFLHC